MHSCAEWHCLAILHHLQPLDRGPVDTMDGAKPASQPEVIESSQSTEEKRCHLNSTRSDGNAQHKSVPNEVNRER